jgi:hypothetical protein
MPAAAPRDLLLSPGAFLAGAAARRLFWPPIVAAMVASILFAVVAVPRIDFEKAALDALDAKGAAVQMTPIERDAALLTARRIGTLASYAGAAVGPWVSALVAAFALWLAFKVVGGRPGFPGTFTVASWGLLPGAVGTLLAIPAALSRSRIAPTELGQLLPAGLGVLLPAGTTGPLASFLWSVDLFALGSVALVAVGMASVAGVSSRRAAVTVTVLWLSYVAVFRVALPALGGAR